MNKTERLLGIVLELQARKLQTAEKLAETFEVSKRTIYRDIESLCQSGVPIVSKQGEGYSLSTNYFLPPISFTLHETNILLLGINFVKNNFDKEYKQISDITENKIRVILPEELNKKADILNSKFILFSNLESKKQKDFLSIIKTAILENRNLTFKYFAKKGKSTRKVSPYKLINLNNIWYLSSFCFEKKDLRNFRIDRMENLTISNDFFDDKVFEGLTIYKDDRDKKAIAIFPSRLKRWLEEDNFYYIEKIIDKDSFIEVVFKYRNEEEILPWILFWGSNAKVIEPNSLKQKIILETKKILEQY